MKKIFFLFFIITNIYADPLYFCTAADSAYFPHLMNLIGSIHRVNYQELGEIAVFNLGLTEDEIKTLSYIEKVGVYEVEKVHPDILTPFRKNVGGQTARGWYAWKWAAMKQALEMFSSVLWIDAGSTVLKPLNHLFDYIKTHGYFLCTSMIGTEFSPIRWGCTKYVMQRFKLEDPANAGILDKDSAMGGIVGVTRECQDLFVTDLYNLAHEMRPFADDCTAGYGFGDCRHDQTLLSVISCMKKLDILVQDGKQITPMDLNGSDLYITWDPEYACNKTHIYSSRHDLHNFNYFCNYIWCKDKVITSLDKQKLDEFSINKESIYDNFFLAQNCIKNSIVGDFVVCGITADGGDISAIGYALQKHGVQKQIHMFDVFEEAAVGFKKVITDKALNPLEIIYDNLRRWNIASKNVFAYSGLYGYSLPKFAGNIQKISLLKIHNNDYASTKACLEYLCPKLSKGAYIVIDGCSLTECKRAVEEYAREHAVCPRMLSSQEVESGLAWQV